jgi:signal transduction histidine kinase
VYVLVSGSVVKESVMQKIAVSISVFLVSISLGFVVGALIEVVREPLELQTSVTLGASLIANIVLVALVVAPFFLLVRNAAHALINISEGRDATPLDVLPMGMGAKWIGAVNTLIANQQDFQQARGNLYAQISEVAAQEERKRLARDLHDSIKQQIFSMNVSASAAMAHLDNNPSATREALLDVKQSAQEAMVEMRALLQQLSPAPLEKAGLLDALREQCEALSYRTGAQVNTNFGALPDDERLPLGAQTVVFRIAQEALANIARHARAQTVTVSLAMQDDDEPMLVLSIEDDGQGFDANSEPQGMGLHNMRSRAESIHADFSLTSAKGAGTQLRMSMSLITQVEEESNMFEETKAQRQSILQSMWLSAGALVALVFALVLLLGRAIHHSDNFAPDTVIQAIFIIMLMITVIAPFVVFFAGRNAWRSTRQLIAEVGTASQTDFWLRRHRYVAMMMVMVVFAWFVPMLVVQPADSPHLYAPFVVGGSFMALAGWFYYRTYRTYQEEMRRMTPSARIADIQERLKELRTAWWSVGFLILIQFITFNMNDDFQFPPVTQDNWMVLAMLILTGFFTLNQVASIWMYRRWLREAQQVQSYTSQSISTQGATS